MLAKNPKTGKDLRIINLDTSVWRDQKTLVWFDAAPTTPRWSRWDVGTVSTTVADALDASGFVPDVVVALNEPADVIAWLEAGSWSKARLVALPKSIIKQLGVEKLVELKITNMLCLDEMHELYPFTGAAWDGTAEDAKALVATALHFGRTFPVVASASRTEFCANIGLKLMATVETPQELWLVTQYYDPGKGKRQTEINECLQKNAECSVVDRIVLLNERAMGVKDGKIQEKVIGKRLTYADVIRWIYEEAPEDVLVVFANADIFLDADSWRLLWSTDMITKPKFLALLRWDVAGTTAADMEAAKLFGPRADSQDTWVVSSKAVKAMKWDWSALNFPFGQGGCDNAITLEMFKQRFLVANPALSLRTYHYHESEVRTYDPRNIVDKPSYLYIQPTGLHDMRPVTSFGTPHVNSKRQPFNRRINGPLSAAQAKTYCTMLKRVSDDKLTFHTEENNLCHPPPMSIYKLANVFQTRDGLAYTYDSILVGNTKTSTKAWSESQLSSMATSLSVEKALIAPLPDSVAKDAGRYVLQYMSKIFLMRAIEPEGEFWCPKNRSCIEAIKSFRWPNKEIPVLSRDENMQTWCKEALMWPYEDRLDDLVSKEEIGALRSNLGLGGWKEDKEKRIVMMVDPTWVTDEMADALEEKLKDVAVKIVWPGKTATDVFLQALIGAWGIVTVNQDAASWVWAMPKGAFVWEIQSEMQPSATLLHVCAAADLNHRLLIVAKGTPNQREKDMVLQKLVDEMEGFLEPPVGEPETLELILPSKRTDFFSHAGDSFREMARLWGERGYVKVVEAHVQQVWLGGVGETLLYDRPTLQWLEASSERSWKKALFGNPTPADGSPWTFWPRRPSLVEEAVKKGLPMKPFEVRQKNLVFYGRSENAVQRKRRTGADWESVCDDFSHRISTVDSYPYTQEEYLAKLADAKYGLCLAGFGDKCHREIECMAMGCVPVIAPEVDMTYADPPVEGLHYFRVNSPADVKAILEITPERWTVMSAACRDWWDRNASVEGSWLLTQKLHAKM